VAHDPLQLLGDELLVSVAVFLGVRDLGRLSCVAARFAAGRIASPAAAGAAGPRLCIAEAAAELRVASRPQCERERRPRQPGESWLRLLAVLLAGEVWSQYSAAHFVVSEGGARLTAPGEPVSSAAVRGFFVQWRPALATLGGAPMQAGGNGQSVHYVEVELFSAEQDSGGRNAALMVGVGRPGYHRERLPSGRLRGKRDPCRLELDKPYAHDTGNFWGVHTTGTLIGSQGKVCPWWPGDQRGFGRRDTLGLLLDCAAGTLHFYKNGARMGVVSSGLTGALCWAALLRDRGDGVRIHAMPPPVGWRDNVEGDMPPPVDWRDAAAAGAHAPPPGC